MVTHDVDEAVLLSDRIVMLTNGPAATIGEILHVDLPRPRDRMALLDDPDYAAYPRAVLSFLHTSHAPPAKLGNTGHAIGYTAERTPLTIAHPTNTKKNS